MRRIRHTAVLIFLALSAIGASPALPVEPDIQKLLQEAEQPREPFPLARVGWNLGHAAAGPVLNPTYETMRYPWTPAGLRAQLVAYATPDWRVCLLFGLLIFTLRYYRYIKPVERERRGIVTFPSQARFEDAA